MYRKKILVVTLVSFLSIFVLFGCLPSTTEEPQEEETPQELVLRVNLPETTPATATIYLVGDYSDWGFDNAKSSEVETDNEQKYAEFILDFDTTDYPIQYKYTYDADWEYVELDEVGNGIEGNRRLDVKPSKNIEDVVLNWKGLDPIDYTDSQSEITINFVVYVPADTVDDEGKIYMRGLNNDWDRGYELNKTGETYTLSATTTSYTVQKFKFLRINDWGYVEKDESGEEIGDRFTILTEDSTIVSVVESWAK